MAQEPVSFDTILRTHPDANLSEIFDKLNYREQARLMEVILMDEFEPPASWFAVQRDNHPAMQLVSDSDYLYHLLSECPPKLFDHHAETLEQLYLKLLKDHGQKKSRKSLKKIKALVHKTRAGLRDQFFRNLLFSPGLANQEELDLFLLWAKIRENHPYFDPKTIMDEVDLIGRPHLSALRVYLYREENPFEALQTLRMLAGHIYDDLLSYQHEPWLMPYLQTYLRHALYHLLHRPLEGQYHKLKDLQDNLGDTWAGQLLAEILQHPGLEGVSVPYVRFLRDGQLDPTLLPKTEDVDRDLGVVIKEKSPRL